MNTPEVTHTGITLHDLQREHLELAELQATLLKTLVEKSSPTARITSLLQAIGERVRAHFLDEEAGIVRTSAAKQADHDARCRQLCSEHRDLINQFEQIVVIANQCDDAPSPDWWLEVEDAFRQFSVNLTKHEQREQALIEELLLNEEDAGL